MYHSWIHGSHCFLNELTDPDCHLTLRPFFKGQNNQKLCLSYVILWYPTLQVSFALFTVLNSGFFCQLFLPPKIHSVSNPCNISVGHVFWWVFYWLVLYYILTYFPVIQKIFSWLTTKCTGLTLGSIIWILNHFYHDYMTGRQFLGSYGIFNSILCHVICRVSSVKYWQCGNITIVRGGQFQIQEVLHRIGYFGPLCMFRTVSTRQSMWNSPTNCILPRQFQILYRSSLMTSKATTCLHLRPVQLTVTHLGQSEVKAGSHLIPRTHSVSIDYSGLNVLPPELN